MIICFILLKVLFVKDGETALHLVAKGGDYEKVAKILVEHGCNVDLQDTVLNFFFFSFLFVVFLFFKRDDFKRDGCDDFFLKKSFS